MKQYPKVKYLVRPDYEVSSNLHANTNPSRFDPATIDKTAYPKAFKHVRQILKAGCPNMQFVYHAVRGEGPQLYPGDDAVDFVGFSIFNNDVCMPMGSTMGCQSGELDPNDEADLKWAPKPKLIAESAVQAPSAATPAEFLKYLTRVTNLIEKYNVAGWTYINSNWGAHGWPADTWGDSRIEKCTEAKSFWTKKMTSGRYKMAS